MNKILNYEGCPECGNENIFMGIKNLCLYCGYVVISCNLCSVRFKCTEDCIGGSNFFLEKNFVLSLEYIGYKKNLKVIKMADIKI